MQRWKFRSIETANLLNPAFCCAVLASSIVGYSIGDSEGLPFVLSFITLPIVLHKPTRDLLPITSRTSLAGWLENNPKARIQFFERVLSLKPFVRESILFGMSHHWLILERGNLKSTISNSRITNYASRMAGDTKACITRAKILGKWFFAAGSPEMVMALWEIKP